MEAVLDEFDEFLALERGRSEHTRRAYLGDLRSLSDFLAERAPGAGIDRLSLPILRSWLAAQASAGAARTTLGPSYLGGEDLHCVGDAPRAVVD